MTTQRINRIAGMQDINAETSLIRSQVAYRIRSFLASKEYDSIETPVIEDTELLVRKSGGEFVNRMYTFTDPGGRRVSLRPEFTSSVIRHFIETSASVNLPYKVQYKGPVFRYERADVEAYRQFTQVGAEFIGGASVSTDADVLSTGWAGLGAAGLRGHRVRLGHIGVLQSFLAGFDLSEPARLFVIGNLKQLRTGNANIEELLRKARSVGLLASKTETAEFEPLNMADNSSIRGFVYSLLAGGVSGPLGRRTSEEIVERLSKKIEQSKRPEELEEALNLAEELARLSGETKEVLAQTRNLASGNTDASDAINELEALFTTIESQGIDPRYLELDLCLARGLSYYSGVIFDFVYGPQNIVLGGGGRYDALVRSLGGENTPALGFAYTLERVVDAVSTSTTTTAEE